jgi:hypothetical protein
MLHTRDAISHFACIASVTHTSTKKIMSCDDVMSSSARNSRDATQASCDHEEPTSRSGFGICAKERSSVLVELELVCPVLELIGVVIEVVVLVGLMVLALVTGGSGTCVEGTNSGSLLAAATKRPPMRGRRSANALRQWYKT